MVILTKFGVRYASPCAWGRVGFNSRNLGFIILFLLSCVPVFAEAPNFELLANAIYTAEGGKATSHPYGILARYRHTTPRQACINTCKHKYRDWASNSKGKPYLEYLRDAYCPIGASNDPKGLNKNWLKNVKRGLNGK